MLIHFKDWTVSLAVLQGQRSPQRSDQVQLLAVLAGEDGRGFVVLDQLVHGGEMLLTNAEDTVQQLHLEVFDILTDLQRDGEVAGLEEKKRGTSPNFPLIS